MGVDAEHGPMVMGRLTVSAVPVLSDNYVWLIHDPDSGETAAVDPSVAQPVLDAASAEDLRITQVLNTHWHPDHTGGNDGIRDATGCTITAPAEAERVSRIDRIVVRRRPGHGRGRRSRRMGHSRPYRPGTSLIISRTKA